MKLCRPIPKICLVLLIAMSVILVRAAVAEAVKRSVYFTPYFDLDLKPRKGKARVNDRTEGELFKAGYIPVGTLEVSYRVSQASGPKGAKTYNYPEDPTKDLRKWAAKKGGDVIHIQRTNIPTDGKVTWTEDVWHDKYSGTRYTRKARAQYMNSYGNVYRKDPALVKRIEANPDLHKRYFYIRGNIYLGNDKFYDAQDEYGKALKVDPGYVDAILATGIAKMGYRFEIGAVMDFTKAMEIAPANPSSWYHRGHANLKMWKTADAIRDLEKYLSMDNKKSEAYYLLGIAYERQNRKEDAIRTYLDFVNNADLIRLDSLVEDAVIRVDKLEGKAP